MVEAEQAAAARATPPDGRPLHSRLPRPGRLLRAASHCTVVSRDSRIRLSWSDCRARRAGTAFTAAPIDVHAAGTPCCLAVCSRWASHERGMHTSHIGTTRPCSWQLTLIMTISLPPDTLPGRTRTGHSLRQDALDPGFHSVPTGPAHTSPDADGAGLS
jgi:hypothetical protein